MSHLLEYQGPFGLKWSHQSEYLMCVCMCVCARVCAGVVWMLAGHARRVLKDETHVRVPRVPAYERERERVCVCVCVCGE